MTAPVMLSDSEITGLLKNVYNNFRIHMQNQVTPFVAQLKKTKEGGPQNVRWGGNGAYWNLVTGRAAGGGISASGYLPPDTTATEKQASSGVARAYVRRQIDGLAFAGTKTKEAAFETIASKTLSEIREASALLMEGSLNGAGQGALAIVGTVTDTVTAIVSGPYGVAGAGQGGLLLAVGDYIAFRSSTGTTLRGKAAITAISNSGTNATLTLSASVTFSINDIIIKATTSDDAFAATAGVNQINGLINLTNRGNSYKLCHGVNPTDVPIWDAVRLVAGTDGGSVAAQATESDIWTLMQSIKGRSGKDPFARPGEFLFMTTPGMAKSLMESMIGQRRFDNADFAKNIKGGYRALNLCGIPCFENYYVPAGTIYLLHIPSLGLIDAKDWGFLEYEGAGPWRWVDGRDAFETSYAAYINMVALQRNALGSWTGFTDSTFFSHVV
jgi:hypothetical protein